MISTIINLTLSILNQLFEGLEESIFNSMIQHFIYLFIFCMNSTHKNLFDNLLYIPNR